MLILLLGGSFLVALLTWVIVGMATFNIEKAWNSTVVAFLVVFFGGAWLLGIPIFTWW